MALGQIQAVVRPLLPARLTMRDVAGRSSGYLTAVLDDGRGESLLTVAVQRWKPQDPALVPVFAGARTMSDGVRLLVRRSTPPGGGRGVRRWDADTLRADGLRVIVTQLNARAYGLPATRAEPLLTQGELTALALTPEWS